MIAPAPEPEPAPLLIQQRLALQRRRAFARYQIVVAAIFVVFWTTNLLSYGYWWHLLAVIFFGATAVWGIVTLRAVRKDTRAFEERYGADAGVQ